MKGVREHVFGEQDLAYIETTSPDPDAALEAIEAAAEPEKIPILDRASGRVLGALFAGRRRVVEVGTAIGYSTLWIALSTATDGRIVTIDPDRPRTDRARAFWRQAGIPDERIQVVNAPALAAFEAGEPGLAGPFDAAFIDALKPEYGAYVEALVPRLMPGALVVADNVLWSGRVSGAREPEPDDHSTAALRTFNAAMLADPRFRAAILPIGDGLLVATYRP
jgi:caffeoyl-CoA O-methyltransferase